MPPTEDQAKKIIQEVITANGMQCKVTKVIYRPDYWDFLLILNGRFHCEIREKLIADYVKFNKNEDISREMHYLMEHPVRYEDWELEDLGLSVENTDEGKSEVDDSGKYDFL